MPDPPERTALFYGIVRTWPSLFGGSPRADFVRVAVARMPKRASAFYRRNAALSSCFLPMLPAFSPGAPLPAKARRMLVRKSTPGVKNRTSTPWATQGRFPGACACSGGLQACSQWPRRQGVPFSPSCAFPAPAGWVAFSPLPGSVLSLSGLEGLECLLLRACAGA